MPRDSIKVHLIYDILEENDTDHSVVVSKVRKRMSVSKQASNIMQCNAMQEFYVKVLNLKKLNEVEFREEYQVKI
jgi:hypothetical protein